MNKVILGGALAGAVGLYVFSKTKTGEVAIATAVDAAVSSVRGIRNNNPGNIRRSAEKWQGLAPIQDDPSFFQFVSMPYGIRAMARVLKNYQSKYGLDTVSEIVSRWAPPSENDTYAYISDVARRVGVGIDDSIDTTNRTVLFNLVRAIISHENGAIPAKLISDATVMEGLALS